MQRQGGESEHGQRDVLVTCNIRTQVNVELNVSTAEHRGSRKHNLLEPIIMGPVHCGCLQAASYRSLPCGDKSNNSRCHVM